MTATDEQQALPPFLPRLQAVREPAPGPEIRLRAERVRFGAACRALHDAGARFITVHTVEAPVRFLIAAFALRGRLITLHADVPDGARLEYEALGPWLPAARWAERELSERYGARPSGLEDRAPLSAPDADSLVREVSGLDVFRIPYGPVRSGIFEAIQFLIETGGEDVTRLHTRPFFKHRGMEGRFRGLAPDLAVHVAERVAGIATVAYASAFAQAVEQALEVRPPVRAEQWRVVHAELERLACHFDVIAKQAETTALYVAQARFQILKEQVTRLRAALCGSRFGRGVVVPGGVREEGSVSLDDIVAAFDRLERSFLRDRALFVGTQSMTDRLIGSGRLPREMIEAYGAVGPLARGSGVSVDARHERPYGHYRRLGLRVSTAREGDAMARIEVRFGEIMESLRILRATVDHLRRRVGGLAAPLPESASGSGFGWAEAPQGELLVWVQIADGIVCEVRIASPSFRNWALFDHAFPQDVLTDFAFIEHSFGLTPAGADR